MTPEQIAEATLSCADFKLWSWHREGYTLIQIRGFLIAEEQANEKHKVKHRVMSLSTICRHLQSIRMKLAVARVRNKEGDAIIRIAVEQENVWTGNTAGNPTLSDVIRRERRREMLARHTQED